MPKVPAPLRILCTGQGTLQFAILLDKQIHHLSQARHKGISA